MVGRSRWTGTGGSYRTIQRFFHPTLPWAALLWVFVRTHLLNRDDHDLLVGDECVVTRAGTEPYGVDRFFSSIVGKPVPGVALFARALVSRTERQAFPVQVEQVLREPADSPSPTLPVAQRQPGRPKGSSTQAKADAPLNAEHTRISAMIQSLLTRIGASLRLTYLVLDGHVGNHNAVLMARRLGVQVIAKLRSDSALSYPSDGPYAGRGPRRIYGERIDPHAIPERFLKQSTVEDGIATRIDQVEARQVRFAICSCTSIWRRASSLILRNGDSVKQAAQQGTCVLTGANSTFSGNSDGGGVYNITGTLEVTNSTFFGNIAGASGSGGGVYNVIGTLEVTNSTFSGNYAGTSGSGQGLHVASGTATLRNTIIANSVNGRDCVGTLSRTNNSNLIESAGTYACGLTHGSSGNIIGQDPNLGALTGSPAYFPLLPGSPAIDAGDNAICAAAPVSNQSQNGVVRPQDGDGDSISLCDIGSYERDIVPPALLSFTRHNPAGSPASAGTLVFRATFSEAVQNADATDFVLNALPATTASITAVTQVTPSLYEITVSGGDLGANTYNGVIGLDLSAGQNIADLAGNALPAGEPATDETYTIDNAAPALIITSTAGDPTNVSPIPVTFTFSEAVTGFTAGDVSVANGALSGFSGSGATYTADVTPSADGLVMVSVAAGAAQDAAGNGNTAATFSRIYDTTPPQVTSITRAAPNPTNAASVNFTVTFSELVTGVDASDFSLIVSGISGAAVTGVAGTGAVYTVTVGTGSGSGTLRLDVPATASVTDLAGNPLTGLPFTSGEAYTVRLHVIYLPLMLKNTP